MLSVSLSKSTPLALMILLCLSCSNLVEVDSVPEADPPSNNASLCQQDEDCAVDGPSCQVGACLNGQCVTVQAPEGSICDAGGTCFTAVCQGDQCVASPSPPGTPCDDGVSCTTEDVCDDNQTCSGTPNDRRCPGPEQLCAERSRCLPDDDDADAEGCVAPQTPDALCEGEDVPVFWLDAADGLSTIAETQTHDLQGGLPDFGGDVSVAREINASPPRQGRIVVYDIPFYGAYDRAPTVVLDDTTGSNERGDTFEISAENIGADGFELHVYRTDLPGEGFGKGPDVVSWRTEESWLVNTWTERVTGERLATQANERRMPALTNDAGRPIVSLRDDWLDFPRPIEDDFSVALVFRSTDERGATERWTSCPALLGGELAGEQADMGLTLCAGRVTWGAGDDDFVLKTDADTLYNDGQFHVVVLTRQRDTGEVVVSIDGEERASGTGTAQTLDANDFLRLARHPTGSGAHHVDYGELIFYNQVLDSAHRARVEDYLINKWRQ